MDKKPIIDLGDPTHWQFNACVGTNGIVNDRLYFDGFSDATKVLCKEVLNHDRFLADSLIYPIAFSARHSFEIGIKIAFRIIAILNEEQTPKLLNHDIKKLFGKLKEYAKSSDEITSRLQDLEINIPQIILDLISLDNTGETYRYRRNTKDENHLDRQVRHINIRSIYLGYCKFWEEVDNFLAFLDQLRIDKRENEF